MWQVNSKVSLITNSNIRYEGILVQVKTQDKRLLLQNVKSFGTEGRNNGVNEIPTPAADDPKNFYSLVEFQIPMIKELYIIEKPPGPVPSDPAIVSVTKEDVKENIKTDKVSSEDNKSDERKQDLEEKAPANHNENDIFDESDQPTSNRGRRGHRHHRGNLILRIIPVQFFNSINYLVSFYLTLLFRRGLQRKLS